MSRSDLESLGETRFSPRDVAHEIDALKSEIARLERLLLDQKRRALRERDDDREAIARELHDNIGQYLTIAELELGTMAAHSDLSADLRDRILGLRTLTAEAQRDVSFLARNIRPVALDGLDLKGAIERLIEEWGARSSLTFDLHLSLGKPGLSEKVATTIYRVLQEAITNVAKHANASRVGIILRALPEEIRLVVEDDGTGFVREDLDSARAPRLGLVGIRERLALIGGTLDIEPAAVRGTSLVVRVPL